MDPVRTLERRGIQGGDLPSQETDDLLKQIINSLHTLDYSACIYTNITKSHRYIGISPRSWTHIVGAPGDLVGGCESEAINDYMKYLMLVVTRLHRNKS